MAMAITTYLTIIFTRAKEMTETDAGIHLSKKTHWTISSTTQLLKNPAPHIPSNTLFIISFSLQETDGLILTMQVREVIPQILFHHLSYRP